jgi:poly-gamma-glutamate capsule biosynthesis protein CapA/YwtB (metallophosphatase superfamily)
LLVRKKKIDKIYINDSLVLRIDLLKSPIESSDFFQLGLKDTITIVAVGDIMLGTNYPSAKYLPPNNNCYPLLSEVKPFLSEADIAFGNLEGVFAGEHGNAKSCKNPDQCYVFRMPEHYIDCLVDAGFDVLSVANNHVNDFGVGGRKNTMRVLDTTGLIYAGFIEKPYTVFYYNNLKIGFCAFSPNSGVIDMRNTHAAAEIVKQLNDSCDMVMVSVHGGAEGRNHQHVTRKNETFLGGNRGNIYDFAHKMIDAGADMVLGHGPHVTRAMEVYKDRYIIYSMGNFSTYARVNISGPNGIAPMIKLYVNRQGKFLKGEIISVHQEGEGGAKIDPLKRAQRKLKYLTETDFPEIKFEIKESGEFYLKEEETTN